MQHIQCDVVCWRFLMKQESNVGWMLHIVKKKKTPAHRWACGQRDNVCLCVCEESNFEVNESECDIAIIYVFVV